jgi:adenosylcobinamide-phosphate synthase
MTPSHAGKVATALVLDALVGEPPAALHPTVWMGRMTLAFEKRALGLQNPGSRRLAGVALALSLPTLVFLSTRALICLTPRRLRWVFEGALISTSLSMRGLSEAADAVERELRVGNLEGARIRVGDLVGRDTADLPAPEVARAAVESVAENTSDGVVAPMLYGLLLGAPGALAYRAVNTLDSMVGYRRHLYEELGWASARLDDLANLAPSRATALIVAVVSGRPGATWRTALRYGPLTKSPNAGWAEAAFAGALGLTLGGRNSYGGVLREGPLLGDGRRPEPEDIRRSVQLMRRSCGSVAVAAMLYMLLRGLRHA